MRMQAFPTFANKVLFPACLLAATTFTFGSLQVRAESPTAVSGNSPSVPTGSLVTLAHHTPGKVVDGTAIRIDHYNTEKKLRLAIFVTPPDLAGEEQLIREQQTKGSPNFHKFLSADEWNARFGPKVEDEQKVVDWANSQGLTVTNRYANRILVDVEAPAGVIEKVLSVTINHYQVGEEVDFSNDRDPSIPAHLSGIVGGIFGLNSIERMKPMTGHAEARKNWDYVPGPVHSEGVDSKGDGDPTKAPWNRLAEAAPAQSDAVSGKGAAISASGLTTPNPPDEIGGVDPANLYSSQVYDYNALLAQSKCCNVHNDSTGSPADTSIALVTFGGFLESDANTFFQFYGMAWNITAYSINGFIDGENNYTGTECQIGVDSGCNSDGYDDEADLDVEYSTAFSNSFGSSNDTAHVYVYEGANGYQGTYFDLWNSVLNDGHADVVSTSYGGEETSYWSGYVAGTAVGDAHYIFNQMVGEGLTLVAASGDQGSTPGCGDSNGVIYPSSDPDFVAAGGTALKLNYDGTWASEDAWTGGTTLKNCQGNGGGGGGGLSVLFSAPAWQSGINYEEWVNGKQYTVSGNTQRKVPDISLEAGGYGQWDFCTTGCGSTTANGWGTWGGTSIVAPELAGFFAQENSYLNSIGHICGSSGTDRCEPIGNPAPILYYEGEGQAAPHYPFYDITQGCVTNYLTATDPSLTYFCAEPGYDLATGWGSANMLQLAWAYNFYIIPADGVPSVKFTGPATNTWYNSSQTVKWTVSDGVTSGTAGLPAPGVAGFTQGWDSIPTDVYSEAHGGAGNSFYSGPQYPYGTAGCLSFVAGSCSGGVSQGCHKATVEAWDNQGFYSGAVTYGPICYDTVDPTISASNSPAANANGWWKGSDVVTLTATDPGGSNASGIYKTYYAINSATCLPGSVSSCGVYSGAFTISTQGENYIYYFTEDKAGNYSTVYYQPIYIDTTAPVTTASLSGTLTSGTYYSAVQVTLTATDNLSGVAATYYTLDGGAQTTYSGAFSVSALGSHTVKYWSVDYAGNVGATQSVGFTIASPLPKLTAPTPGTALGTTNVVFTWTAGVGATDYRLFLGTTGVGSLNLYNSGTLTGLTTTVPSIPSTGVTVYAQLLAKIGGTWQSENYTFTESSTSSPAVLSTPAPGTVLGPSNVVFTWTAGVGVTNYKLLLGTTGVGSSNLYSSGSITTTTATVASLPQTGVTVYAQLSSEIGGVWQSNNYTFTESELAAMSTPAPSATLGTTNVVFTWTKGVGSTDYRLFLGTTGVGSLNLYNSGTLTTTTATVPSIPASGVTVYARLYSKIAGTWQSVDYTYTEQ